MLAAGLAAGAASARAGEAAQSGGADPRGVLQRETLTGDWGGARKRLEDSGVSLGAEYIGETLANLSGGLRRGAVYQGRFEMAAELDLEKLAGWRGASIFASAYQIHGHGLSPEFLGNLLVPSNIEAHPATRLFTAWFQRNWDENRLSLRLGQIAADDEFAISDTAAHFINGTFGWFAHTASNLPSGGPAYPLATPGARFAAMPAEDVTVRAAVFSGDPAGRPGAEDPQLHDNSGTTFSLQGGVLAMAEVQVAAHWAGLPGAYKLGGWYHSGSFHNLRRDALGLSLADPASSGVPARHRGDHGIYAVADQMVYRESGSKDRGLSLSLRLGAAPSDRNPVDLYLEASAAYKGPFAGRDGDIAGVAVGYAHISGDLQGLDRDARAFSGVSTPVHDHETVVELTYIAEIAPWWRVQPDVQLLFHPGGNVAHPGDLTGIATVPDAVVAGVRTRIAF